MDATDEQPTAENLDTALPDRVIAGEEVAPPLQMPYIPARDESAGWIAAVRRFHITGLADRPGSHDSTDSSLTPAALRARTWRTEAQEGADLATSETSQSVSPWTQLLTAAAAGWHGQLGKFSNTFAREIARLQQSPDSAGDQALILLVASACHLEAHVRRQRFVVEVENLIRRLRNLLATDEGETAGPLGAALGEAAAAHIDAEALSRFLPSSTGPVDMSPDRRSRLEPLLASLRSYLQTASRNPEVVIFCCDPFEAASNLPIQIQVQARPVEAAAAHFDQLAAQLIEVIRAVRGAKTELARQDTPVQTEAPSEPIDWKRLRAEELGLLPQIVVVESSDRLLGPDMGAFSTAMRSGRPLKFVATECLDGDDQPVDLVENKLGLGQLALAHREAFVFQGNLAQPQRLLQGFRKLATASRPSAALVTAAKNAGTEARTLLDAAHAGRDASSLTYDPDAGLNRDERLELAANPDPERDWPAFEIEYLDARGKVSRQTEYFTFAHAAAVNLAYRSHFWVLPRNGWSAEQLEISLYLESSRERQAGSIPFLWVVTEEKILARAVMTQEMAFACKDRLDIWRHLQGLAAANGTRAGDGAEAGTGPSRNVAEEDLLQMKAAHEEELERVRRQTKQQAVERLILGLLGPTKPS